MNCKKNGGLGGTTIAAAIKNIPKGAEELHPGLVEAGAGRLPVLRGQ